MRSFVYEKLRLALQCMNDGELDKARALLKVSMELQRLIPCSFGKRKLSEDLIESSTPQFPDSSHLPLVSDNSTAELTPPYGPKLPSTTSALVKLTSQLVFKLAKEYRNRGVSAQDKTMLLRSRELVRVVHYLKSQESCVIRAQYVLPTAMNVSASPENGHSLIGNENAQSSVDFDLISSVVNI